MASSLADAYTLYFPHSSCFKTGSSLLWIFFFFNSGLECGNANCSLLIKGVTAGRVRKEQVQKNVTGRGKSKSLLPRKHPAQNPAPQNSIILKCLQETHKQVFLLPLVSQEMGEQSTATEYSEVWMKEVLVVGNIRGNVARNESS